MRFLLAVSVLWAFSFGIIGSRLTGLDSTFVATARLGLAFLCFLPFLRIRSLNARELLQLVGIGALQFGVMYLSYIKAFAYLPSHLVALFSVLTPLYIVLAHDLMKRRFHWTLLGCALLSIAGAVVIKYSHPSGSVWIGFGLMQIANLSFGLGQLLYRSWRGKRPYIHDGNVMAALYLGGTALAAIGFVLWGDTTKIDPSTDQIYALAYLGVIASGLGFYWWNKGAARSRTGTLAAFNNAVVPLAMATSIFVFGEVDSIDTESVAKLIVGSLLIFAAIAWGRHRDQKQKLESA